MSILSAHKSEALFSNNSFKDYVWIVSDVRLSCIGYKFSIATFVMLKMLFYCQIINALLSSLYFTLKINLYAYLKRISLMRVCVSFFI